MKKIINKVNELAVRGSIKAAQTKAKIHDILAQQSGEGFVDTARASVRAYQLHRVVMSADD